MITSIAIFSILILIMSVVIHEVSHGYAAYIQGDPTAYYENRLTLNPLKHLDLMGSVIVPIITTILGFPFGWAKPVPFNPYNLRNQRWGELWVALAGPLSNIVIAIVFGFIVRYGFLVLPGKFIVLSTLVVIVNLWLAMFNLIPIPPLDGSKVLFSFLPYKWSKFRYGFERYAFYIIVLILFIPEFSIVLGWVVGYTFTLITGHPISAFGVML